MKNRIFSQSLEMRKGTFFSIHTMVFFGLMALLSGSSVQSAPDLNKTAGTYKLSACNSEMIASKRFATPGSSKPMSLEAFAPPDTSGPFVCLYGDSLANYGFSMKYHDEALYVAGRTTLPGGDGRATLSKFDLQGNRLWSVRNDIASTFADLLVASDSFIYAVGFTLPFNTSNATIVSKISLDGQLHWTRTLDQSLRERPYRIIEHANPLNAQYPYYVSGQINGPSDDNILFTMDADGQIGNRWSFEIDDDDFGRGLIQRQNGNLLMYGRATGAQHYGEILELDNAGNLINSYELDREYAINEIEENANGDLIGVGEILIGQGGFVFYLDSNFQMEWAIENPMQSRFEDVELLNSDKILVTGRYLSAPHYTQLSRFDFSSGLPVYEGTRYLHDGESSYSSPEIIYRSAQEQLFYMDSRQRTGCSPGDFDFLIACTDSSFRSCITLDDTLNFNSVMLGISPVAVTRTDIGAPSTVVDSSSIPLEYEKFGLCDSICCQAAFTFVINPPPDFVDPDPCARIVEFTNTSCVYNGSYEWDFGDGQGSTADDPVHTYDQFGTYTVTLYATSCDSACMDTTTATVDIQSPFGLFCALDTSCLISFDSCQIALPDYRDSVLVVDECGVLDQLVQYPLPGSLAGPGCEEILLIAYDTLGNSDSCFITVCVKDTFTPRISCVDTTLTTDPFDCFASSVMPEIDYGPCAMEDTLLVMRSDSGELNDPYFVGLTQVKWIAVSTNGLRDTCDFTVTVLDDEPPVAVCQDVTVSLNAIGQVTVNPNDVNAGSFDNCAIDFIDLIPADFDCGDIGSNSVQLIVLDVAGNSATCTAIVEVEDDLPPNVGCMDITVSVDQNGQAQISPNDVEDFASDNCGISNKMLDQDQFNCGDLGDHNVTLTVTDLSGNSASCTAVVTLEDQIPPVAVCPPDLTINNDPNQCSAFVALMLQQQSDNCSVIDIVNDFNGGGVDASGNYPVGTTVVTWVVTDQSGNTASCATTVTVLDTEDPVLVCPPDTCISISADSTAVQFFYNSMASDNCQIDFSDCFPVSGSVFPIGIHTINCQAVDVSGNSALCQFTIEVKQDSATTPAYDLSCGQAVMTCQSGDRNNGSNPNGMVVAVQDIRNRNGLTPINNDLSANFPKYWHPSWINQNLGEVFGVALDNDFNIYLSETAIYNGPNTFGPAGNTGGEVYLIPHNTLVPQLLVRLPNTGQGLGNLCYVEEFNSLYVTNFQDGMIYQIDLNTYNGNPNASSNWEPFDPFPASPDIPTQGFTPLERRNWGIGYFNERIYIGTWRQSVGYCMTSQSGGGKLINAGVGVNSVWSMPVDNASGAINGIATHEFDLDPAYTDNSNNVTLTNPISDIAFSSEGRMLVTEKTMCPDNESGAHYARVIEYENNLAGFPVGSWTVSSSEYYVGEGNGETEGRMSAGGVDYGYDSFNDSLVDPPVTCDSMVWASCDVYQLGGFPAEYIYGLAGMPASGNMPYPLLNTYFIDAAPGVSAGKTEIGDVEIFKCGCPLDSLLCDSLMVMLDSLSMDTCCWSVDLKNNWGDSLVKVDFNLATPGVEFTNAQAGPGFSLLNGGAPGMLTLEHLSGSIPQGMSPNALSFCLGGIDDPAETPQKIVVKWYREVPGTGNRVVCKDSLMTQCPPPVPGNDCLSFLPDSIVCSPDNAYEYCLYFKVTNNSSNTIDKIALRDIIPGFAFKHCPPFDFLPPNNDLDLPLTGNLNLAPGQTSPQQCVKIVSSAEVFDTVNVYFRAGLSLPGGGGNCCFQQDSVCIPLIPCCNPCEDISLVTDTLPNDTLDCCHSVDIVNGCEYEFFSGIETEIITPGVIFGSHFIGGPDAAYWSNPAASQTYIKWEPSTGAISSGIINDLINFCLDDIDEPLEQPQKLVVRYLTNAFGAMDSVACTDTLVFNCEPVIDYNCVQLSDPVLDCTADSNRYDFTFTITNQAYPAYPANFVELFSQTNGVFVFPTPLDLTPALQPGDSRTLSTSIYLTGGSTAPPPVDSMKLLMRLSYFTADSTWCCNQSDTFCLALPNCAPCDSLLVNINPVNLPDTVMCQALSLSMNASGGSGAYDCQWSPPQYLDDPQDCSTTFTPAFDSDHTYTYVATVTDTVYGCSAMDTVVFTTDCTGPCNCEQDTIDIDTGLFDPKVYHAVLNVTSRGRTKVDDRTIIRAGREYDLAPGFEVPLGSEFVGDIMECDTGCCLNYDGYDAINPYGLYGDRHFGEFIDVDNDGDYDYLSLIHTGFGDRFAIISNIGDANNPVFDYSSISTWGTTLYYNPYAYDYNGDGYMDFFAINKQNLKLYYFENQGYSNWHWFIPYYTGITFPAFSSNFVVEDFSNDGLPDIIVGSWANNNYEFVYYEDSGVNCSSATAASPCFKLASNDFNHPFIQINTTPRNFFRLEAEDFECDGDMDLFVTIGKNGGSMIDRWVFRNYGGTANPGDLPDMERKNYLLNPLDMGTIPHNWEEVSLNFVDIDGDGDQDAFMETGDLMYYIECDQVEGN